MVKIYADGADIDQMHAIAKNPAVQGFTTNPTLMRKAGVTDYKAFAKRAIGMFKKYPISFEVFADDFHSMESQAREIASWGENVYVKIPICTTTGASSGPLITRLAKAGVKVNITAVFCFEQIDIAFDALWDTAAVVSVFAGRIADTGRNPVGIVNHALKRKAFTTHEVLWASPRQALDIYTADSLGCDIITCTPDLIAKMPLEGKNLKEYSRETVAMFYEDAKAAGYTI